MELDIPFGNSNRENGTTFLDFPLLLGIFQWDEPTKRVPFTAEPEIPEILTKTVGPTSLMATNSGQACAGHFALQRTDFSRRPRDAQFKRYTSRQNSSYTLVSIPSVNDKVLAFRSR